MGGGGGGKGMGEFLIFMGLLCEPVWPSGKALGW